MTQAEIEYRRSFGAWWTRHGPEIDERLRRQLMTTRDIAKAAYRRGVEDAERRQRLEEIAKNAETDTSEAAMRAEYARGCRQIADDAS